MINRYFVINLIALCGGIAFYSYGNIFLLICEILVLLFLFILKKRNVFLIAIVMALIGGLLSNFHLNIEGKLLNDYVDNEKNSGTFQIVDVIYQSSYNSLCIAKISEIENTACSENIKLSIYSRKPVVNNGIYDFIDIKIQRSDKSDILAYGSNKTFFEAKISDKSLTFKEIANDGFINKLRNLRIKTNNRINQVFNSDTGALMCALYTGETIYISNHHKDIFRETGIYHMLSVSGMHVAILMTVLGFVFDRFGKLKYIKYIFLVIFVLFTGASPAIIRAAGIGMFIGLSQLVKRNSDSINILAMIALISLLSNPLLLFDKSFQLSYLATYGVMAVSPVFYIDGGNAVFDFFSKTAATTIAAQIMTLPVTLTLNTEVSFVSIVTNTISTFFTSFLYVSSLIALIIPTKFTIFMCETIASILFKTAEFFTGENIFDINFTNTDSAIRITAIVAVIFFLVTIDRKSRIKRKRIEEHITQAGQD